MASERRVRRQYPEKRGSAPDSSSPSPACVLAILSMLQPFLRAHLALDKTPAAGRTVKSWCSLVYSLHVTIDAGRKAEDVRSLSELAARRKRVPPEMGR